VKEFFRKVIPKTTFENLRKWYWLNTDGSSFQSFSQEGEDMILRKIFYKQETGFYVDVGAFHPKKSSNTYFFYKKGWSGINIDAMPGSMKVFNQVRKRDINLEIPIGIDGANVSYYEFEDKALNGFESSTLKNKDQSKSQNQIKKIHKLKARSLNAILGQYLPSGKEIDFLTIDVEGQELNVLKEFDFNKYAPSWILSEIWNYSMKIGFVNPVDTILKQNGYVPKAKTPNTVFYQKAK
jgi:FkbM family methyltransferase